MMKEKKHTYSIRKYSIGVLSVAVSAFFMEGSSMAAHAVEAVATTAVADTTSKSETGVEETEESQFLESNELLISEEETSEGSVKQEMAVDSDGSGEDAVEAAAVASVQPRMTRSSADATKVVQAVLPLNADSTLLITTETVQPAKVQVLYTDGTSEIKSADAQESYIPKQNDASSVVNGVKSQFQSVTFEDFYDVLQPRTRFIDEVNIKNELRKQYGRTPTDEEVKQALKAYYLDALDMRASFQKVQQNLDTLLAGVVEHSSTANQEKLLANKVKILLGLTYLERQYSFQFGNVTAKDLILYYPEVFGSTSDVLDNLITIGNLSYDDALLANSAKTYTKKIAPITQQTDLLTFIENNVKRFTEYPSASDWLKAESKAYIEEATSTIGGTTDLITKMKSDETLKSHLIPLLTLTEDNIYVLTTVKTVHYGLVDTYVDRSNAATKDSFLTSLQSTVQHQQAFLEFWYRMTEKKNELMQHNEIIVVDTMQRYSSNANATALSLWSPKTGDQALSGVREFMTPLNMYSNHMMADGQANGKRMVTLYLAKSLTDRGQSVYTHELTHMLDEAIWFNGDGRRAGKGVEVFARGLFESINNLNSGYQPIFNLNTAYTLGENRVQNASPTRFQTDEDVKEYMQGLLDVIYTLDYAEATAILEKEAAERALLFNKVELTPDQTTPTKMNDTFSRITTEEAAKLQNVDDLIDNGIVSGRLAFKGNLSTGTTEQNGYFVVPLFEPIYAALQNDEGAVGDITFRRNAYELLGEYGYQNGMEAYVSGKYANDKDALEAILADVYGGDLATFKKAMFKRRIDKVNELRAVNSMETFDELMAKMREAINTDLAQMQKNSQSGVALTTRVTAVQQLKEAIFKEYLLATNDFETSIYEPKETPQRIYDITLEYVFDNQTLHIEQIQVVEGESISLPTVEGYVPAADTGVYIVDEEELDATALTSIQETKTIKIPLYHRIPADVIKVFNKQAIRSIEVIQPMDTTQYTEGDVLDMTGLQLKLTDEEGISKVIEATQLSEYGVEVTPSTSTALAVSHTTVTFSVQQQEATVGIVVAALPVAQTKAEEYPATATAVTYKTTTEEATARQQVVDAVQVDPAAGEVTKEVQGALLTTAGTYTLQVKVTYSDASYHVVDVSVTVEEESVPPVSKTKAEEYLATATAVTYKTTTEEATARQQVVGAVQVDTAAGEVTKEVQGALPTTAGTYTLQVKVTYSDASYHVVDVSVTVEEESVPPVLKTKAEEYPATATAVTYKTTTKEATARQQVVDAVQVDPAAGEVTKEVQGVLPTTAGTYTLQVKVTYSDSSYNVVDVSITVEEESIPVPITPDAGKDEPSSNEPISEVEKPTPVKPIEEREISKKDEPASVESTQELPNTGAGSAFWANGLATLVLGVAAYWSKKKK